MKQVEFTTQPPKYEVCAYAGLAVIRFYCDVQEFEREEGQMGYTCTCYEMLVKYNDKLNERIEKNYDAWLATAIEKDGGLNAVKQEKIAQSKAELAAYIASHPLTSTAHGGVAGVYSVTEEKQALMTSQYISYQAEKQFNPDAVLTWNETGKACEVWTEQEFLQLVIEIKQYVYPLVSHQQKLEEEIAAAATLSDIEAIVIDYDAVH